jgi:hypothetical protein
MLTGILGTGGAVLLAGIALLIKKFRHHIPGSKSDEALLTVAIIVMVAAGVEFAAVGAGRWGVGIIHGVEGWVGPVGAVVIALIVFFMFVAVVVAIFRTSHEGALSIAFFFPLMCSVPTHGYPVQLINALKPPAQQLTTLIRTKMGA